MKEIVINSCFGGFGLSYEGVMEYAKLKGITLYAYINDNFNEYKPYKGKGKYIFLSYYTKPIEEIEEENRDEFYFSIYDINRDDPTLVQTVKNLGKKSWGNCAELKIVKIPDDINWQIEEYDGSEHIAETHRTWS